MDTCSRLDEPRGVLMERRQRRSFTDDYKRQAVDLVGSSGRSIGSVAKELGPRDSVLLRWVEQRGARREPTAAQRPITQATVTRHVQTWLQQDERLHQWRRVPSFTVAGYPWARRWAYQVAMG